MKILIIQDDFRIASHCKKALERLYTVETAVSGEEGEYYSSLNCFDLIILDAFLPYANGIDLCKKLRSQKNTTPILVITGQTKLHEKLQAFSSGVDDYLTKPFELSELLARVQALLRRPRNLYFEKISVGDLTIDLISKTVWRKENLISLRRKEYLILEYLIRHMGKVVSREELLDHVWEMNEESVGNVVDVHIKYLRDQMDRKFDKKLIKTVHGMGYKIEA